MTRQDFAKRCEQLAIECETTLPKASVVLLSLASQVLNYSEDAMMDFAADEAQRLIDTVEARQGN